jgi:hypothetical protein
MADMRRIAAVHVAADRVDSRIKVAFVIEEPDRPAVKRCRSQSFCNKMGSLQIQALACCVGPLQDRCMGRPGMGDEIPGRQHSSGREAHVLCDQAAWWLRQRFSASRGWREAR